MNICTETVCRARDTFLTGDGHLIRVIRVILIRVIPATVTASARRASADQLGPDATDDSSGRRTVYMRLPHKNSLSLSLSSSLSELSDLVRVIRVIRVTVSTQSDKRCRCRYEICLIVRMSACSVNWEN